MRLNVLPICDFMILLEAFHIALAVGEKADKAWGEIKVWPKLLRLAGLLLAFNRFSPKCHDIPTYPTSLTLPCLPTLLVELLLVDYNNLYLP